MTQIDFYTHVSDKLRIACSLVAKAYGQGLKVFAYCPDRETAQRLDRMLWTTPPTAFMPHCTARDPLAPVTPVLIDYDVETPPAADVLINLRAERPAFFGRFQRLVEIVSTDNEDRAQARERFRFYRDSGYELRTHDLSDSNA